MSIFEKIFPEKIKIPEMFYCHQHGKAMFTEPYRALCLAENHETELYRSDEFKLWKDKAYYETIEKDALERGEMEL